MNRWIGIALVLAGASAGVGADAGTMAPVRQDAVRIEVPSGGRTMIASELGPSGVPAVRAAVGCNALPGRDPPAMANPPPANMRYWCNRCVAQGGQHFHPDCPAGSRCAPNNGQAQCGGGSF
jgi:hypothetical protein